MEMRMMVYSLIVNIAVLVIIANILSHVPAFQRSIQREHRSLREDFNLSIVFFAIIVVSTLMEIKTTSYSLNTRMIGTMAAGLLGGPVTGFFASMLGGIFVFFYTSPASLARSMAFSTVCCGLLGAGFYPYFQRGHWKYKDMVLLGAFAEVFEIFSLIRLTVSLKVAVNAIMGIAVPMILINSIGLVLFIANFNYVFLSQDAETSNQLRRFAEAAEKLVPLFDAGLDNTEKLREFASAMLDTFGYSGVMITDRNKIKVWEHHESGFPEEFSDALPRIAEDCMRSGTLFRMYEPYRDNTVWRKVLQENYSAAIPLTVLDETRGSLVIWVKRKWYQNTIDMEFLRILEMMIGFRLSARELKLQQQLRNQAEFKALQFQVNPHFLFNALNTISFVCREDSEKARKLMRVLASFFRYNLNADTYFVPFSGELEHVRDYLRIESARFEEKLQVEIELDHRKDIEVPVLILQPIVENAVRYGIGRDGVRYVGITSQDNAEGMEVTVEDHGKGFPEDVLQRIRAHRDPGDHIGLDNVNHRLISIYGADYGLLIESSENGSRVTLRFPFSREEMRNSYENRNY